jgi:hypothetical protein
MKKWTLSLALVVCGYYLTPTTGQAEQQGRSIECRDTCSTFASALRGLSGANDKAAGATAFEAFTRSCRRLCVREVFSEPALEGITDILSSLPAEEVRTLVVPAKPLPRPSQNTDRVGSTSVRATAKALAARTPFATVTATVTAIATYSAPGVGGYYPFK